MDITNKDIPHIMQAISMCSKSAMLQTHGCVVAIGSKIISTGYNHYRTYFKKNNYMAKDACSCHAEMHAIRNAMAALSPKQSSKKRKKVNKYCKL